MKAIDPGRVDAMYRPFPGFIGWLDQRPLDLPALQSKAQELRAIQGAGETLLSGARQFLLRAAAFDTGALEALYSTTRGLTKSVAAQVASWESMIERHAGNNARRLFEAQLAAYELVVKAAIEEMPLSEAWIRRLHEVLCQNQETYTVRTPLGVQEQPLPRGVYKTHPNHVWLSEDEYFAFAPVADTAAEMARLLQEMQHSAFLEAEPIVQAAYAHYALVRIHPFADGNGRVARALASLFTSRAYSTPIVIFSDQRRDYFAGLQQADRGSPGDFVAFLARSLEATLQICLDQVRRGATPKPSDEVHELEALYQGRGGLPIEEVDDGLYGFAEALLQEVERQISELQQSPVQITAEIQQTGTYTGREGYRAPVSKGGRQVRILFVMRPPAQTQFATTVLFWVRRDDLPGPDFLVTAAIRSDRTTSIDPLELRVDEVWPQIRTATMVRLSSWVAALLGTSLGELRRLANTVRSAKGY